MILRLWEFDSPRPHNRFSPLWFAVRRTRLPALFVGLGMHAMIGPMFGPVVWFALLMAGLLFGSYAPARWLLRLFRARAAA